MHREYDRVVVRHRPFLAALALVASCAPASAYDVRPLAHRDGVPGSTPDGLSFVSAAGARSVSCFSADARWVTFASWGVDLVPGQVNDGYAAVYLTDRTTGATSIVSHAPASPTTTANAFSSSSTISADGRWVAYSGQSTNVVAGMTAGNPDGNVFLYDRLSGANQLVSHVPGSVLTGGNALSHSPFVSADGHFVAFLSQATNLVTAELLAHDPSEPDVFLFDRLTGQVTLVSHAAGFVSRTGNAAVSEFVLSADARYIAFPSTASDLVPGQVDPPGFQFPDVFLFDRVTGSTTLVSHVAGAPASSGNSFSQAPSITADGRFVAYMSSASDIVPQMVDANMFLGDVLLWDRTSDTTILVSRAPGDAKTTADGHSVFPKISADGSAVAYASTSVSLVAGQADPNGSMYDVFVFDRTSGSNTLVSMGIVAASQTGSQESFNPAINANGSRIAFESRAQDLVPNPTNGFVNVFVFDRTGGKTQLASRRPVAPGVAGNGDSTGPLLSADGNLVAFDSLATDLAASDLNGSVDAFLYAPVTFGSSLKLTPLAPCRLVDTRILGSALAATSARDFAVAGICAIPADAVAISLNVTVTQPQAAGFVDVYPAGLAAPQTAILSFAAGQTRANNAHVALGGTPDGTVTVWNASPGSVHVVLDVNGFYR